MLELILRSVCVQLPRNTPKTSKNFAKFSDLFFQFFLPNGSEWIRMDPNASECVKTIEKLRENVEKLRENVEKLRENFRENSRIACFSKNIRTSRIPEISQNIKSPGGSVANKHSVYTNTMKINTNVVFNKHRVCVQ